MSTEYDNIDVIGTTHEISRNETDRKMNGYYHKQELASVIELLEQMKLENFEQVIDLGCSIGTWYGDYRRLGFKHIIGIDISEERLEIAKKRGYDETHCCNAYKLPFENDSQNYIISNDVLVHVIQDSDKSKIFDEIFRILKKNGIFIFNVANASGFGKKTDTTVGYCRYNTIKTISDLINNSGLKIEFILPSYYTYPRIGAHPYFVSLSTSIIFPFIDYILKSKNNTSLSKVIYFAVRKK